MTTQNPLGKGLAALLGSEYLDKTFAEKGLIDITHIKANPKQPRQSFPQEQMAELISSIKLKGILQPLIVRKQDGIFEIIAGERRWRAAQKAGLTQIPVMILNCTEEESLEIALIENLQRQDLNPMEEAESLKVLQDKHKKSQEEIAMHIGKSRSYVANMLRLNNVSSLAKEKIRNGEISAGHARALINVENVDQIVGKIIQENLSVRDTEQLIRQIKNKKNNTNYSEGNPLEIDAALIAESLKKRLLTSVGLKLTKNGGCINIYFNSYEQLDSIIQKITG